MQEIPRTREEAISFLRSLAREFFCERMRVVEVFFNVSVHAPNDPALLEREIRNTYYQELSRRDEVVVLEGGSLNADAWATANCLAADFVEVREVKEIIAVAMVMGEGWDPNDPGRADSR